MKILAVRIGDKYGPEYETYLERKLPFEFIWVREPIEENILFQWNKMSGMNLDIDEPICVIDIDILLVNDYMEIFNYPIERGEFLSIPSWWSDKGYKINGWFFKYYPKDCRYIYDTFMADPEHWQKHYIENGTTTGPVNGEQYFVEEQVKRKLQLVTLPNSWVTRWGDQDWTWQFNMTEKYREVTGNKWLYMDKEFHPDIKLVHFTHQTNYITNRPHQWEDYSLFL